MLLKLFLVYFLVGNTLAEISDDSQDSSSSYSIEPRTSSPSGVFRGAWMETQRGRKFQAYRGIRYAEPPVDELRFQPPKLIVQYHEEVNATVDGPACPQPVSEGYYVDEDCLRINVYTPDNNSSKLHPVIVYLHSGGFYSVSGRSDIAGPHYLLERDIVLVTLNYRLGTLGLLSTGDELAPGNNALKDQVAALRWVQRNIKAFGGNPDLVTLAGYSVGALSVGLHMVSNMTKGLFHQAIAMSESPIAQMNITTEQHYLAVRQAEILSCPTNTSKEIVDCLKTKTWKELGDSLDNMFEFGFDPIILWNVVIEQDFGQERFITRQPLDDIREGNMHSVPLIISQTQDEFFWKAFSVLNNETLTNTMNSEWERIAQISFQLPKENGSAIANILKDAYLDGKNLVNDSDTAQGLGKLYADSVIGFPVHRMAKLMTRRSTHPVYFYEFAYIGNNSHYVDPDTGRPIGAAHHDDLIYLFTLPISFPTIALGTEDSSIVDKMTAIWFNFARYGDPNPRSDSPELEGLSWPVMTTSDLQYLRIDSNFTIHKNLYEERYDLWDELYPIEY